MEIDNEVLDASHSNILLYEDFQTYEDFQYSRVMALLYDSTIGVISANPSVALSTFVIERDIQYWLSSNAF